MRILYFLAHPDSIGGAMKVLLTQAYIMQKHGNEVKVVIQNDDDGKHIPEYNKLCELYELSFTEEKFAIATCIEEIDLIKSMSHYKDVKKIIMNYRPEIIHSVQLNMVVEYVARELDIPHIMNIYQVMDGMFNIKWMNIFPKYHIGDTYFYCKKWHEGLKIESICIRAAYDSKQKKVMQPLLQVNNKNRIEIINIAHLAEHKRQFEIIKFIEKCKNDGYDVHINLIGHDKTEYAQKCKDYVKTHNLGMQVSFIGAVLDLEKYLKKADLMVHASTSESYPSVIVMAMCNYVPVLATPVAGVPELIKDEENGFLSKGYTCEDLYTKFKRYIDFKEKGLINNIIVKAYETYLMNNTYDVTYKTLDIFYHKILNENTKDEKRYTDIERICGIVLDYGEKINLKEWSYETKCHLWYIYHIKQTIDKNKYKTAIIWGAGNWGKIAIEWCKILSLNIICITDSYKEGTFEGYIIEKPTRDKLAGVDVIFLAIWNMQVCEDNIKIIEDAGKKRNIDYFLTCNNPCIHTND